MQILISYANSDSTKSILDFHYHFWAVNKTPKKRTTTSDIYVNYQLSVYTL